MSGLRDFCVQSSLHVAGSSSRSAPAIIPSASFWRRAPSPYNEDDADIEGQFQCCERFVVFGFQLGHSNRLDVSIRTGCSEQAIPQGLRVISCSHFSSPWNRGGILQGAFLCGSKLAGHHSWQCCNPADTLQIVTTIKKKLQGQFLPPSCWPLEALRIKPSMKEYALKRIGPLS